MKSHLFFLALVVIGTDSLLAAVDTGQPTSGTPYDRYHGPVRQVLGRAGSTSPPIDQVRSQFRTARRYRYYFNAAEPYTPQAPAVTESRQQGDCKAKSLWLASKMNDRTVRYAVGRATLGSKMLHAWLLWPNAGTWLFLDPTLESDVLNADRVTGRKLIMKYTYTGSATYFHPSYSQYIR